LRRLVESFVDNALNVAWHLAALTLAATGVALLLRWRSAAVLCGTSTVMLGALIGRSARHRAEVDRSRTGALRVMTLNAYNRGTAIEERVARYARAHDVDVLFLQEWDEPAARTLGHLDAYFPRHAVEEPDGTQIYARLPFEVRGRHRPDESPHQETMIEVAFDVGGVEVVSFAIHPLQPVHPDRFGMRRRELEWLAELVEGVTAPVLIAGDCNASVLSPDFQRFLGRTGLRSVSGWPPVGTWPAALGPFGIAIDHVLLRGLTATSFEVGPSLGSDHRVVVADVAPEVDRRA